MKLLSFMEDDEFFDEALQEDPEVQMDNDEISAEEEGFMKGYEDGVDSESDFDPNSDDE